MAPKRLFIFCDGTGKDGMIAPDGPTEDVFNANQGFMNGVSQTVLAMAEADSPDSSNGGPYVTNVLRLSRAVKPYSSDKDKIQQIVFYQSGVGSEADFLGKVDVTTKAVLQGLGRCVASKIRDAYGFLAQNFQKGDEIFLFGFSRGAYTARKLAQLIDKIGLLTTENLGLFFNIWKKLFDGKTPNIPSDTRKTNIKCLGVWDTVQAMYAKDALGLGDTLLPASVQVALHAVSLQENRKEFRPTPFSLAKNSKQILKEVWFPGAHSDVGGSYQRHEIADIALFWMVGEIKLLSLFEIDYNFINRSQQQNPDNWGASQPNNAYSRTAAWKRTAKIITPQNRLESGDITRGQANHKSWAESPDPPQDKNYMVTLSAQRKQYGTLTFVELNAYENERKNHWKDKQNDSPIVYDDITVLFPSTGFDAEESEDQVNEVA